MWNRVIQLKNFVKYVPPRSSLSIFYSPKICRLCHCSILKIINLYVLKSKIRPCFLILLFYRREPYFACSFLFNHLLMKLNIFHLCHIVHEKYKIESVFWITMTIVVTFYRKEIQIIFLNFLLFKDSSFSLYSKHKTWG